MKKVLILLSLTGLMLCLSSTLNAQQKKDTIRNVNKNNWPNATICGLKEGVIAKDTLMKAVSLKCTDKNYQIVSFTMIKMMKDLSSTNNMLTEEMKKGIAELKPGDKVIFDDIRARSPEGKIVRLAPIILKVR